MSDVFENFWMWSGYVFALAYLYTVLMIPVVYTVRSMQMFCIHFWNTVSHNAPRLSWRFVCSVTDVQ